MSINEVHVRIVIQDNTPNNGEWAEMKIIAI